MPKKDTNTLPEHTIIDGESSFSKLAAGAMDARRKVNEYTAIEKEKKGVITVDAEALRSEKAEKDEIIGKIVISPPNQAATRVEFCLNNGSLDSSEMKTLDELFGAARPELFEKVEVVDKVTDPDALCASLHKAGLNPWDYVELKVRHNKDQTVIVHGGGHIMTADAILPRKGIVAIVSRLMGNFKDDAKAYIKEYLELALKPKVVLGSKLNHNKQLNKESRL